MGGAGDLLSLSLNVPPWQDLHELSRDELRLTNLVTTDMVAQPGSPALVELTAKPAQDRFVSSAVATETNPVSAKSTQHVDGTPPPASRVSLPEPDAYLSWTVTDARTAPDLPTCPPNFTRLGCVTTPSFMFTEKL